MPLRRYIGVTGKKRSTWVTSVITVNIATRHAPNPNYVGVSLRLVHAYMSRWKTRAEINVPFLFDSRFFLYWSLTTKHIFFSKIQAKKEWPAAIWSLMIVALYFSTNGFYTALLSVAVSMSWIVCAYIACIFLSIHIRFRFLTFQRIRFYSLWVTELLLKIVVLKCWPTKVCPSITDLLWEVCLLIYSLQF